MFLDRGGDGDRELMAEARARDEREVMSATTRMFVAMIQQNEHARSLLTDVAPTAFPWVRLWTSRAVRDQHIDLSETGDELLCLVRASQLGSVGDHVGALGLEQFDHGWPWPGRGLVHRIASPNRVNLARSPLPRLAVGTRLTGSGLR